MHSGFYDDLKGIVIDGQRGNSRAVVVFHVVPGPTRAEGWTAKKTFVSNKIAADSLDSGLGYGNNERFERLKDVIAIQARIDGWITASINNEIAFENPAMIRLALRIERSLDGIGGAEPIQGERNGVQFRIGRRAKKLLRIVFKKGLARIQRNNFNAPESRREARLGNVGREPLLQFRYCLRRLLILSERGR